MKKIIIIIISSIILISIVSTLIYSQISDKTQTKEIPKITAIVGKQISISSSLVIGDGNFTAEYDSEYFQLDKKITEPSLKYYFTALKEGETEIKIIYKENDKTDVERYKITIKSEGKTDEGDASSDKIIDASSKIKDIDSTTKIKNKNDASDTVDWGDSTNPLLEKIDSSNTDSTDSSINQMSTEELLNREMEYINKLYNSSLFQEAYEETLAMENNFKNSKLYNEFILLKSKILTGMKKSSDATKTLDDYIQIDKKNAFDEENANAYLNLANIYINNKEYPKAEVIYLKLLTFFDFPKIKALAHLNLGKLYFTKKDYKKASQILESFLKDDTYKNMDNEIAESLYTLGEIYFVNSPIENYQKSYEYFFRLTEDYPRSEFAPISKKRLQYIDENFINYK